MVLINFYIFDFGSNFKKIKAIIILVPIISDKTFMISDIKDEKDRIRFYSKEDHVRGYGLDFEELLKNTGFKIEVINYTKELSESEIQYLGLLKVDLIFHCRK